MSTIRLIAVSVTAVALSIPAAPRADSRTGYDARAGAPVVEGAATEVPAAGGAGAPVDPAAAEAAAAAAAEATATRAEAVRASEAAAAEAAQAVAEFEAASQLKLEKMNAATSADARFQASRTQANMIARDQAEDEAAEAIRRAHAAQERAITAKDAAARAAAAVEGGGKR